MTTAVESRTHHGRHAAGKRKGRLATIRRVRSGEMKRRRGQIVAVIVTIFLGIVLFGSSYDAFLNLQASYDQMYDDLAFADLTMVGGDVSAFAAAATTDPAVAAVQVRRTVEVPIEINGHRLLGRAVSLPDGGEPSVNRVMVLEGDARVPSRGTVFLEQHLAGHYDLGPGDTIRVLGAQGWLDAPVTGVAASPEFVWPARSQQDVLTSPEDFGVLFVPESTMDSLAGEPVSEVGVRLTGTVDSDAALSRLEEAAVSDGSLNVYDRSEQPSNAALQEDVKGFGEMSYMFPMLFLGSAGLAMYVLLTRLVYSQRPFIGLLRAQGYRRRHVFRHYLGYGITIGLLGAIPGAIAGVGLASLITRLYTSAISVPVVVTQVRVSTIVTGIVFGLVGGALSAASPALLASRTEPAAAMRGLDGDRAMARPSWFERLVPPLRRAPARWRMVLRNIGRNPRRTLSTMTGVVLAVVLVLASWGMIDTMQVLLDRQFNQVQRQDAIAMFPGGVTAVSVDAARDSSGIDRVETAILASVSLVAGENRYATTLQAFESDTVMHSFIVDGEAAPLPDSGLLVGSPLRDILSIEVGDSVDVQVPEMGLTVTTTVAGFVDEPLGTLAYVSKDHLASLVGLPNPDVAANAVMVTYDNGVDRRATRDALADALPGAAVQDARTLYETALDFMGLFYAFVGVMLVFGGIMAFALIYAMMASNVAERGGEIAVLRASGASSTGLGRTITAENLLLTLLALPVGVAAGWGMSALFMSSFSSDLFRFDLHMRGSTPIFAAGGILVAALIAQIPVMRMVRRVDIARVVRERSQ